MLLRLKKKRTVYKYSSYICFSQGYESAILQRPFVCISVEQIGKYITDNKTKVSYCQRRKLQIKKVRRLKQTLKLWTGTEGITMNSRFVKVDGQKDTCVCQCTYIYFLAPSAKKDQKQYTLYSHKQSQHLDLGF